MLSWSLFAALTACDASLQPLAIESSDPPVAADGVFYDDIAYDAYAVTTFDLFLPPGEGPFPLVFQVHGGGFTGGDSSELYEADAGGEAYVGAFISQGIAVANVNYRLLDEVDAVGVIKPLGDSRRCLQFIRAHAEQLQIDPARIVGDGTSAGAGTVIWLAVHPDTADAEAEDPVLRESTRILAANAQETQASYDLYKWETDVFADYGLTIALQASLGFEQQILSFYGATSLDQLLFEPIVSYRADVDMLGLMSDDDPPLRVENANLPDGFPTSVDALYHHPRHARSVRDAALAGGLDVTARIPAFDIDDGESAADFLIQSLE